jgi:uncharacterized protein (AIM24 family)
LKPSEQILINPYALMANSENITNEMKRNFRGLFSGSNFVLLNMLNKSNDNGAIFLSSYGGIFKTEVKAGEEYRLASGHFLCCSGNTEYELSKVGSLFSTVMSGSYIVMKFKGPCTLYYQGRNLHELTSFIGGIAVDYAGKR